MTEEQTKYKSYLLRLWQTDSEGQQVWQASLEHPGSGERRGFADLEALFDFLALCRTENWYLLLASTSSG